MYAYRNFADTETETKLLSFGKVTGALVRPEHLTSFQVSLPKELDPVTLAVEICSLQKLIGNVKVAILVDQE